MKIIRRKVFETNSSSTHSITMCMGNDFNKWEKGEVYLYNKEFITKEKAQEIFRKSTLSNKFKYDFDKDTVAYKEVVVNYKEKEKLMTKENLDEITEEEIQTHIESSFDRYGMPLTYEQYYEDIEYETYVDEFTTPNGEKIISFGYYGSDY